MHLVHRPHWRSSTKFAYPRVCNATYNRFMLCDIRLIFDLHSHLFDWQTHSWRVSNAEVDFGKSFNFDQKLREFWISTGNWKFSNFDRKLKKVVFQPKIGKFRVSNEHGRNSNFDQESSKIHVLTKKFRVHISSPRWPWKTTAIFACVATFLFFICGVFLLKDWVDTKERNYWPPNTTR